MIRTARVARHGLLLMVLAAAATGCRRNVIDCRGPPPPKPLVLGERMPDDFDFALWTYDDSTPRTSLDVDVRADGSGSWRVWVPATKSETARGEFHAAAARVDSVWRALVAAKFDAIDGGEPPPDVCSGGASGVQRFAVWAGESSRYVWRPRGAADVGPIREAVLDLVPRDVAARFSGASPR